MRNRTLQGTLTQLALCAVASLTLQTGLLAQGRGPAGPPPVPKAAAPFDMTGYWVSVVTEDWRYRMVMPAVGDYNGVPLTPAARKVADTFDLAKEMASPDQCRSYGAPTILRVPGRIHITWQDDNTLKLETDAGKQTRVFHFGDWKAPAGPATLQGDSKAQWELQRVGGQTQNGSLKVETNHLKAGLLRQNGVPYSENATLTEYYDMVKSPNGDDMLVVTIVTVDPANLRESFIVSSQFKKQASDAGWKPTECSAKW